jgi:hypothetical protein
MTHDPCVVDGGPADWSLEDVAAALLVAMDGLEAFEQAGADLLLGIPRQALSTAMCYHDRR